MHMPTRVIDTMRLGCTMGSQRLLNLWPFCSILHIVLCLGRGARWLCCNLKSAIALERCSSSLRRVTSFLLSSSFVMACGTVLGDWVVGHLGLDHLLAFRHRWCLILLILQQSRTGHLQKENVFHGVDGLVYKRHRIITASIKRQSLHSGRSMIHGHHHNCAQ